MKEPIKLPTIDNIKITMAFDEGKEKLYLQLVFEDVPPIKEFLPDAYQHLGPDGQRHAMNQVVARARLRLVTAIKHRNTERAKLKESRRKAKKLLRAAQ